MRHAEAIAQLVKLRARRGHEGEARSAFLGRNRLGAPEKIKPRTPTAPCLTEVEGINADERKRVVLGLRDEKRGRANKAPVVKHGHTAKLTVLVERGIAGHLRLGRANDRVGRLVDVLRHPVRPTVQIVKFTERQLLILNHFPSPPMLLADSSDT